MNGKFEQHQVADCSRATDPAGVSEGDGRWVVVGPPDPAILLPGATEQATEPITTPVPTLSPAARAPVNLGMWLSVQPAGPIVARAELGPLWAETTATLATTSFDLGTGDAARGVWRSRHADSRQQEELDRAGPVRVHVSGRFRWWKLRHHDHLDLDGDLGAVRRFDRQ